MTLPQSARTPAERGRASSPGPASLAEAIFAAIEAERARNPGTEPSYILAVLGDVTNRVMAEAHTPIATVEVWARTIVEIHAAELAQQAAEAEAPEGAEGDAQTPH